MSECCRNSRTGLKRTVLGGTLFTVLAVLMPKCPMCIAAWLGVIGLSGLAEVVDPRALWLIAALMVSVGGMAMVHRFTQSPKKGHST